MKNITAYSGNGLLNNEAYQNLQGHLNELNFIIIGLFLQSKLITKEQYNNIKGVNLDGILDLETGIYTPGKNIFFHMKDWGALLYLDTSNIKIENFILNKLQYFLNSSSYGKKLIQMRDIHEQYKIIG